MSTPTLPTSPLTEAERIELERLQQVVSDFRKIVEQTPLNQIVAAVANYRMFNNYQEVRR